MSTLYCPPISQAELRQLWLHLVAPDRQPCLHNHSRTIEFLKATHCPIQETLHWLTFNRGTCDCSVVIEVLCGYWFHWIRSEDPEWLLDEMRLDVMGGTLLGSDMLVQFGVYDGCEPEYQDYVDGSHDHKAESLTDRFLEITPAKVIGSMSATERQVAQEVTRRIGYNQRSEFLYKRAKHRTVAKQLGCSKQLQLLTKKHELELPAIRSVWNHQESKYLLSRLIPPQELVRNEPLTIAKLPA